nr:hypothetical protein [Desulfovibrio sp.]
DIPETFSLTREEANLLKMCRNPAARESLKKAGAREDRIDDMISRDLLFASAGELTALPALIWKKIPRQPERDELNSWHAPEKEI